MTLATALLLAGAPLGALRAQAAPAATPVPDLQGRLDPATLRLVQAVIDSATAQALPAEPLAAKALEGAAKQAPGDRIVAAVRSLARDLGLARQAIGDGADEASLTAGASALRAGASAGTVHELSGAREGASVAWPLTVLADLVGRGVPVDTASRVVLDLAKARATDADYGELEQQIAGDVSAGVPPGAAAVARAGQTASRGAPRTTPSIPPAGRDAQPPTASHGHRR